MTAKPIRRNVVHAVASSIPGHWKCKLSCGHWVYPSGRSKNGQPPSPPYTARCHECEKAQP